MWSKIELVFLDLMAQLVWDSPSGVFFKGSQEIGRCI